MSRIVVLMEPGKNRRLLCEWLSLRHDVGGVDSPDAVDSDFDLGIVDTSSLEHHASWIAALRSAVQLLFLPFLLVVPRPIATTVPGQVWHLVDDLIVTPVEKLELQARVDTLLRSRALSVANASLAICLEAELAHAREVQAGLLPLEPPRLRGFEMAARCVPARRSEETSATGSRWTARRSSASET